MCPMKEKQKQKQKQKQSVVVNVNVGDKSKGAKKKRRRPRKRPTGGYQSGYGGGGGGGLPPFPYYGFPHQQSVEPTLNNITSYLKQKEGAENNRYVNIMAGIRAIERDEGRQNTLPQTQTQEAPKSAPPSPRQLRLSFDTINTPLSTPPPSPIYRPPTPPLLFQQVWKPKPFPPTPQREAQIPIEEPDRQPPSRRTKLQMSEARAMGEEDLRTKVKQLTMGREASVAMEQGAIHSSLAGPTIGAWKQSQGLL